MSWDGINPVVNCTISWPNWEIVQCATDLEYLTGFIPSQLMTNTSACCYSL